MNFAKVIDLMSLVARSAGPISHLIEAGTPVLDAVHKQAPELGAAIKELVAANVRAELPKPKPAAEPGRGVLHMPVPLSHEQAAAAVAKAIFTPYCVDQHEKAWMDRASAAQFG